MIVLLMGLVIVLAKRSLLARDGLLWLIGLYAIWSFSSTFWASVKSEALSYSFKTLVPLVIFALLTSSRVDRKRLMRDVVVGSRVFLVMILLVLSVSLVKLVAAGGYSNDNLYELKILFGHKSIAAAALVLLLPLTLIQTPENGLGKLLKPILTLWTVVLVILLQSRAAYLAFLPLMGLGVYYFIKNRRAALRKRSIRWYMVGALTIILAMVSLNEGLRERMNVAKYLKAQTATERQLIWLKSIPLIKDHWIVGVGAGNWKTEFPGYGVEGSYRMQDQAVFFTRMHNDFLERWSELGLVGLGIYLSILGLFFIRVVRHPGWNTYLLAAGMMAFLIFSFIDFPRERIELLILFSMYLVLSAASGRSTFLRQPISTAVGVVLTFMLVVASVATLFRYQGEQNMRSLIRNATTHNWREVILFADSAISPWYQLDPSSVPIAFYAGNAHYKLGNKAMAKASFLDAQEICPHNFHVLNNLATISIEEHDFKSARQYIDQALDINSRFEDALYNLTYLQILQGEFDDARATLQKIPSESDKKILYREEIDRLSGE